MSFRAHDYRELDDLCISRSRTDEMEAESYDDLNR